MANIRHARSVGYRPADVYAAQRGFLAQIICDAVLICKGERKASQQDIADCQAFLQSERCHRWLSYLNIEPDCLKRII